MSQDPMIHSFKLIEQRYSDETGSEASIYEHEKTGAKVLHLSNDSKNKTFAVGFRTPPESSNGIAHILEHSVLSGSEKFKTKEPFMDLIQTSMQTFLNAMTFSDMTLYPVASKNDKDFHNLMEVYLDAVFFPNVYNQKKIFQQEGWHYEMADMDSPITYNGVVYNEMRGAYSSPDAMVSRNVMRTLYPESTYAHESGGDPWDIPNLSYEEFLNFHKRLYHPSNSLIFLYGDMDFEKVAKFIDEEYLSRFDRIDPKSDIQPGHVLDEYKEETFKFNAEPGEEAEGDAILTYNIPLGKQSEAKAKILSDVLTEVLLTGEAAPLRRALLEAGLGEEIQPLPSDGLYMTFGVMAKKAKASRVKELKEITDRVLKEQVDKGFDRDLVEAVLNSTETEMRELGGPVRGVFLAIMAMYDFRLDMDLLTTLSFNKALQEVREGLDDNILEKFVAERLLDADGALLAVHVPDPDLYKGFDAEQRKELDAFKESLSEDEKQKIIDETKELLVYQQTEDSPEAKATIPSLSLEDVSTELEDIPEVEKDLNGVAGFFHPTAAAGLNYSNLYFPLHHLSLEEMKDLQILLSLITKVDTETMGFAKLNTEIRKLSSGISFNTVAKDVDGELKRYLNVAYTTIGDQVHDMVPLVQEILLTSKFDDAARAKEILLQKKLRTEMLFDNSAHQIGMFRAIGKDNPAYFLMDLAGGIAFYEHLCDVLEDDGKLAATLERLSMIAKKVFNGHGLNIYVTADDKDLDKIADTYAAFAGALPAEEYQDVALENPLVPGQEAFTTAAGVNYVCLGTDYRKLGYTFKPGMTVLSNLLSMAYLHGLIRAQGGAYGAGNLLREDGGLAFYSYRDPQMKKTYEVYQTVPQFIANLPVDQETLDKTIIGSVNTFDPVITPMQINSLIFNRKLAGKTLADQEALLKELLETTVEEVKGYAELYQKMLEENNLTVIGYTETIEKDKDMFDTVERLKR